LALELEGPRLKLQAAENQRAGGEGLATLPHPQTNLRREISFIADVKGRNVGKIIVICDQAHHDVLRALRDDEISINRACDWMKYSHDDQIKELCQYRSQKRVKGSRIKDEERKFDRELKKSMELTPDPLEANVIARAILQMSGHSAKVFVVESDEPILGISRPLLRELRIQAPLFSRDVT